MAVGPEGARSLRTDMMHHEDRTHAAEDRSHKSVQTAEMQGAKACPDNAEP